MTGGTQRFVVRGIAKVRRGLAARLGWLGTGLVGAMMPVAVLTSIDAIAPVARFVGAGLGYLGLAAFFGWAILRLTASAKPGAVEVLEGGGTRAAATYRQTGHARLRFERDGAEDFDVPRAEVLRGVVRPRPPPGEAGRRPGDPLTLSTLDLYVELTLRSGDVVRVEVGDVTEGFELLAAAGLDAKDQKVSVHRRRTGQFTAASLCSLMLGSVFGGMALATWQLLQSRSAAMIYFVGMFLLMRLFLRAFGPGTIAVGADGVIYGKWRRRIVRVGELGGARLVTDSLHLDLRSGEVVTIPLGPLEPGVWQMLVERINRAIALAAGGAEELVILDRGHRSLTEWRAAMAQILGGSGDYRAQHVPRPRVIETLEDPNAPPERRLGAALCLAQTEGARDTENALGVRGLLLRVAEGIADEELAEALRETADGRLGQKTADALRRG